MARERLDWYRVDTGVVDDPRTHALAHYLEISIDEALGRLLRLFDWCARWAPTGEVPAAHLHGLRTAVHRSYTGRTPAQEDPRTASQLAEIVAQLDYLPPELAPYVASGWLAANPDTTALVLVDWWEANGMHLNRIRAERERWEQRKKRGWKRPAKERSKHPPAPAQLSLGAPGGAPPVHRRCTGVDVDVDVDSGVLHSAFHPAPNLIARAGVGVEGLVKTSDTRKTGSAEVTS